MSAAAPRTFFDKAWADHVIAPLDAGSDLLQVDRLVLHELSGSQAVRALAEAGRGPMSRTQVYTVIEHLISTRPGRGPTDSVSKSGPSMIETTRRASIDWGFHFIDGQLPNANLMQLGAITVPRREYLARLSAAMELPTRRGRWVLESQGGQGARCAAIE